LKLPTKVLIIIGRYAVGSTHAFKDQLHPERLRDSYHRVIQNLAGLQEIQVYDVDTWFDKDKEDMTLKTVKDAFGSSLKTRWRTEVSC
jgi:hypothetical protein